jgi:Major Facilitator Superfamily
LVLFASFIAYESRTRAPMLPLALFSHRNFSVANAQTFAMYGGIGLLGFFVTIYLQQVAGYSALKSGVTGLVPTAVMFALSARMGKLADRYGARPFLVVGPLFVSAGFALMLRYGTSVSLLTDVLPALLVFSFGLAMTVAPLTATVLADASESDAGIASAVNNAIARTAGLISVAAVGAVVAANHASALDSKLGDRLPASSHAAVVQAQRRTFGTINRSAIPPADRAFAEAAAASASEGAFHLAMGIGSVLLLITGIGGLALRTQRRSPVQSGDCGGGQLAGQPRAVLTGLTKHVPLPASVTSGRSRE